MLYIYIGSVTEPQYEFDSNMSGTLAESYDEETDLHEGITFPLIEQ